MTYTYEGIEFDSQDEIEFYIWLKCMESMGMVCSIAVHPRTYVLFEGERFSMKETMKTKVKQVERSVLQPHTYTPDFQFHSADARLGYLINMYPAYPGPMATAYIVDVKNKAYSIYNNHREFSINQKWMQQKNGTHVNMVDPRKLFKQTFVPEEIRYMKNRKVPTVRKPFIKCPTEQEFIRAVKTFNGLGINRACYKRCKE